MRSYSVPGEHVRWFLMIAISDDWCDSQEASGSPSLGTRRLASKMTHFSQIRLVHPAGMSMLKGHFI
jgi:hypothetical protein